MGPVKNAKVEQMLNKHAPKETNAMVRMPAGRSAFLLSQPIKLPKTTAINSRRPQSHSAFDSPRSFHSRAHLQGLYSKQKNIAEERMSEPSVLDEDTLKGIPYHTGDCETRIVEG